MIRISLQNAIRLIVFMIASIPLTLHAQVATTPALREKITAYIHEKFGFPATVKITMTDLRETAYPNYLETTVTLDDGKNKRSQPLFVSKDFHYMVEGSIFNLDGDPREEIVRLISLKDQPAVGPASAPVTMVEYSDLECPVCARLHEELEKEIIPKYGAKLQVVFKEYPLIAIHDWAMPAAIAAQCVYEIDPARYFDFRSAVYKSQASVNAEHARDLLLHFAAEAGVDNPALPACVDAKSSLPRVEENIREADALGVSQTPTIFINGRTVVGAPAAAQLEKIIDEAMLDKK